MEVPESKAPAAPKVPGSNESKVEAPEPKESKLKVPEPEVLELNAAGLASNAPEPEALEPNAPGPEPRVSEPRVPEPKVPAPKVSEQPQVPASKRQERELPKLKISALSSLWELPGLRSLRLKLSTWQLSTLKSLTLKSLTLKLSTLKSRTLRSLTLKSLKLKLSTLKSLTLKSRTLKSLKLKLLTLKSRMLESLRLKLSTLNLPGLKLFKRKLSKLNLLKRKLLQRKLPKWLILCSMIFCFICGGIAAGLLTAYLSQLPQLEWLEEYSLPVSTMVYSADDQLIAEFYQQQRVFVLLSEMPKDLVNAVVAVEDGDFFSHHGVDFTAIIRAFYVDFKAGKIKEGGSTITQQLAKVLFLTPEKSLSRKIKEAILAIQIEQRYTKNEILELYLNQIYLGNGAYGVESAARAVFGKSVRDLSLPECAMIAGLPRSPNRYSPQNDFYLALERRNHVLRRMMESEYITQEQFHFAISSPLRMASKQKEELAPHFAEYIRQYLEEKYGANLLYKGGLNVYTTLDEEMQRAACRAVAAGLDAIDERRDESGLQRRGDLPAEAALVAIDPCHGFVKAMVGGRDFFQSKFNRATQAVRQPGSAIKPIIYTAAIENGFTPADIIIDSPFVLDDSENGGKQWKPENFSKRFYGPTTLRTALEESRNVVTVKLAHQLGIDVVISYIHKMGITSPVARVLSTAIGTCSVSLLELTSSYSPLANGGTKVEPLFIRRVTDREGKVLEENTARKRRAISPQTAYIMTSMLQGVIQRGTGQAASVLPYPLAGKTGTTDRCVDAWFVGYSPDLVAGVWMGLDNNQSLGPDETGARAACPIWVRFMGQVLSRENKALNFKVPDGLSFVFIDPENGLLAESDLPNKFLEVFKKGTEPKKYSPARKRIKIRDNDSYLNFIE